MVRCWNIEVGNIGKLGLSFKKERTCDSQYWTVWIPILRSNMQWHPEVFWVRNAGGVCFEANFLQVIQEDLESFIWNSFMQESSLRLPILRSTQFHHQHWAHHHHLWRRLRGLLLLNHQASFLMSLRSHWVQMQWRSQLLLLMNSWSWYPWICLVPKHHLLQHGHHLPWLTSFRQSYRSPWHRQSQPIDGPRDCSARDTMSRWLCSQSLLHSNFLYQLLQLAS